MFKHIQQVATLRRENRYSAAIKFLRAHAPPRYAMPDYLFYLHECAVTYSATGLYQEANTHFSESLELTRKPHLTKNKWAWSLIQQGRLKSAQDLISEYRDPTISLLSQSEQLAFLAIEARIDMLMGRVDLALKKFRTCKDDSKVHRRIEKYQRFIEYQKCADFEFDHITMLDEFARALARRHSDLPHTMDLDFLKNRMEETTGTDLHEEIRSVLALHYLYMGDIEQALSQSRQAVETLPGSPYTNSAYIKIHLRNGRKQDATDRLITALDHPDCALQSSNTPFISLVQAFEDAGERTVAHFIADHILKRDKNPTQIEIAAQRYLARHSL